jgi:hypothetical protein
MSMFYSLKKKFPGIFDKRDRLPMIDYDQLSINPTANNPKLSLTNELSRRSRSMVKKQNLFLEFRNNYNCFRRIKNPN